MLEMTMKDFETKLQDIFTDEQIERLNEYGRESAKDADDNYNDDKGRWHVCEWLGYADIEEIRSIVPDFTDEQAGWLYDQIAEEW